MGMWDFPEDRGQLEFMQGIQLGTLRPLDCWMASPQPLMKFLTMFKSA